MGNDLIKRLIISNKKADLGHLYKTIEELRSKTPGNSDVVFGMEATGIYSLPLYSALTRDGHKVKLYNPIQTNGFRKMNIRKTKTDPIDAAIIADMLRFSEPPQVNPIKDLNLYQLRELVRIRDRLIDKQTVCKVQLGLILLLANREGLRISPDRYQKEVLLCFERHYFLQV